MASGGQHWRPCSGYSSSWRRGPAWLLPGENICLPSAASGMGSWSISSIVIRRSSNSRMTSSRLLADGSLAFAFCKQASSSRAFQAFLRFRFLS
jgi:hypothetical protein